MNKLKKEKDLFRNSTALIKDFLEAQHARMYRSRKAILIKNPEDHDGDGSMISLCMSDDDGRD